MPFEEVISQDTEDVFVLEAAGKKMALKIGFRMQRSGDDGWKVEEGAGVSSGAGSRSVGRRVLSS